MESSGPDRLLHGDAELSGRLGSQKTNHIQRTFKNEISVFEQEIQQFPGEENRRHAKWHPSTFSLSVRAIFQKGVEDSQKNSEEQLEEFATEDFKGRRLSLTIGC
jgi:hypothetical protein